MVGVAADKRVWCLIRLSARLASASRGDVFVADTFSTAAAWSHCRSGRQSARVGLLSVMRAGVLSLLS